MVLRITTCIHKWTQVSAHDLSATTLQAFWSGISFLLTSVALLPAHIAFSDVFGRKLTLYACLAFFALGSLIVGLAHSGNLLVVGRSIQGVGGGGLEALCEIIMTDMTTLKERPIYLGLLGGLFAAGSILGPIVGALFTQYVTWRWVAWINLPIAGLSFILIFYFLNLQTDTTGFRDKLRRVDFVGMIFFTTGITSFLLAIVWGGQLFRWQDWQTLLPLTIGIALICAFFVWERHSMDPIIPIGLLKHRNVALSFLGALFHGITLWSLVFYFPIYFQGALEQDPMSSVISSFPGAFTITPMSIVCAFVIDAVRRYAWTIWLGWTLSTVGFGTMILLDSRSSYALYHGLQIPTGLGQGVLFPALNMAVQAVADPNEVGLATGLFVFSRSLGSAFGVSIAATVFSNVFGKELAALNLPQNFELPNSMEAVDFIPLPRTLSTSSQLKASVQNVYGDSVKYIWLLMACLSACGLVSGFFIRDASIEAEEYGRQAFLNEG